MLDIMRRKKRLKLVLWLVIISLGMGMLLFFVPGQNVGIQGFDNSVATVDGEGITAKEFADAYQRTINNYTAGGRNTLDAETLKRLQVDKQTLNSLIQVRVVDYAAKRLGLDVTNDEVSQAIQSNPNLRNQSGFIGVEAYKAVLAANRIEVEQFEDGMRFMLMSKKVMNLLTDSLTVPDSQLRENFARQNQEAQVQYAVLEKETEKKKINPSESDLHTYFDANKDKYNIKEERRAEYLLFPLAIIGPTLKVTEPEIEQAWLKTDREEKVRASHILFKIDDPKKDVEVKARAEAVLKRVQAGEDFAELARKDSQDEGSAPQGGDLGFFPRGRMTKAFEDACFALKPGTISGLVRTEFGYHIIKVIAHETPDKEQARPNLIRSVQIEKATTIAKQKAAEALKMLETQKDMAAVAKAIGVPAEIKETPFFNRSVEPSSIQLSQDFVDQVFGLKDVSAMGKIVDLAAGPVIPKLVQVNPPKPADFKLALESVRKDYLDAKASELLQAEAQKLLQDAKNTNDMAKAAPKYGAVLKTSQVFKRDGAPDKDIGTNSEFNSTAFGLAVGGVGGPVTLAGGKQVAVLQLKSLTPFNEDEFAKQKSTLREQSLASVRQAYFEDYIRKVTDELNKARKIRINTSALERLTGIRN